MPLRSVPQVRAPNLGANLGSFKYRTEWTAQDRESKVLGGVGGYSFSQVSAQNRARTWGTRP